MNKKTIHIIGLGATANDFKPDGSLTIGVNDVECCDMQVCVDRPNVFKMKRELSIRNLNNLCFYSHLEDWRSIKGFKKIQLKNIAAHAGRWSEFIPSSNNSPFVACGIAYYYYDATEIRLWGVDFNDHPHIKDEMREQAVKDYGLLNKKLNGIIQSHPESYLYGKI